MAIYTVIAYIPISDALNYDVVRARTLAYVLLCMVQISHAYWCRFPFERIKSMKNLYNVFTTSKDVNIAVIISTSLLLLSVHIPKINNAFDITPLYWLDWIIITIAVAVHAIVMDFLKMIMIKFNVS